MSHVDEGMLHAYLDGELPADERTTLEAHLAQCDACRGRLVEERALLERASALLGAARPVERPAPAFEQLRRGPKRSLWRVRTPVAWAASIALALGLGYVLRDVGAYRRAPLADSPAPATPGRVAVQERDTFTTRIATRAATPAAGAREEIAQRFAKPRSDEEADRALPQMGRRVDSGAMKVAVRASPAPAGPPQSAVADSALVIVDGARRAAAATVAEAVGAPSARMQRDEALTEREPSANTWPRIDRQTAKTILGEDPVGLPDLTTLTFRRSPDRDGSVVVVEQELDNRTVIQIFQQQSARANARFDSLVYARSSTFYRSADRERADRLARYVGKLRVEIGGPVSVDSLNRLLDQVAPLRP